jgi:hypothetical protein
MNHPFRMLTAIIFSRLSPVTSSPPHTISHYQPRRESPLGPTRPFPPGPEPRRLAPFRPALPSCTAASGQDLQSRPFLPRPKSREEFRPRGWSSIDLQGMLFTDTRVMYLNAAGCPPEGRCQANVTCPRGQRQNTILLQLCPARSTFRAWHAIPEGGSGRPAVLPQQQRIRRRGLGLGLKLMACALGQSLCRSASF